MDTVKMKMPSSYKSGNVIVQLPDGSTTLIDLNGYVNIPVEYTTIFLNSGYSLIQEDISENESQ